MTVACTLRCFVASILLAASYSAAAQGLLRGTVTAAGDPVIGAVVQVGLQGTVTDEQGRFQLTLAPGNYTVRFSHVGYSTLEMAVAIADKQEVDLSVVLQPAGRDLDPVVITASRYEKNLTEETVSMEVLRPALLHSTNPVSLDAALQQVPGLIFVDNQANIRGGSGFSYGAGSRVLMLVDDIPQLTADAGDIKWDFIPLESVEQVEIIKGASSVLYGSSALNGVINVRTAYATSEPRTNASAFHGLYLNPRHPDRIWWGNQQPFFSGMSLMHARRIGATDLVSGTYLFSDNSFREGEYNRRGRLNVHLRHRPASLPGLSAGINTNVQHNHGGTFFIWQNDTSGAYRPLGGMDSATTTISEGQTTRLSVDPYLIWSRPNQPRHALRFRHFYTHNVNNTRQGSAAYIHYGEYQFDHRLHAQLLLIAGLSGSMSVVRSELYENHNGSNLAAFGQLEWSLRRLRMVGGLRLERFSIDDVHSPLKPVMRIGMNYQVKPATFVRASFGQGYRFPTIAEKFVNTSIDVLRVFPNPDVQPERGWSAEAGIKQALQISEWKAFADLALFVQRYYDLIEFRFGYYDPNPIPGGINLEYLGFKSVNVGNARITGAEFSLMGQGWLGPVQANLLTGITWIYPVNLDQKKFVDSLLAFSDSLSATVTDSLRETIILNYRFCTTIKFSADLQYRGWGLGLMTQYYSFMKNIDPFFEGTDPLLIYIFGEPTEFIPGIRSFRERHNRGSLVMDMRLSRQLSEAVSLSVVVKNIWNAEYAIRPALLEAPRSVQLLLQGTF
ncbi:MAG: TonB-dependent receptor [Chitinophagales bacterium]|nr:TonB-dependent receptor [Chitinophagales bacterium]MDW8393322.1 TonB-dependent receptor [Chitinophagales bacterium]